MEVQKATTELPGPNLQGKFFFIGGFFAKLV